MIDDYTGKHPNRIIMEIGCRSTMNFAYLFTAFFRSGLTSFVKGAHPHNFIFLYLKYKHVFKAKLVDRSIFFTVGTHCTVLHQHNIKKAVAAGNS